MSRCKFVPSRGVYRTRCCCDATPGRADGLCHTHRKLAARDNPAFRERQAALLRLRRGSDVPKKACLTCTKLAPEPRLKAGVCPACRRLEAAARDAVRVHVRERDLCSVAGCESPRAIGRTCCRHVIRFEKPLLAPRPRAEHFLNRNRDPMEGL